ncbi:hypothetical protein D3C73_904160 [compost metagenome]
MQLFAGKIDEGGLVAFFGQPVIGFARLRHILADRRRIHAPVVVGDPVGDFLLDADLQPAADGRRGIVELAGPGQITRPADGCGFLDDNDLRAFIRR